MTFSGKREAFFLFLGDLLCMLVSLWIMLLIRFGGGFDRVVFINHLVPFSILFVFWILVFFIAGLYEKHTLLFQNKLPTNILNAQIVNVFLAVLFFYLIPYFGITPKTNLFIYLLVSSIFILIWRLWGQRMLGFRIKQKAVVIGSGSEMKELKREVNDNPRYGLHFISSMDLEKAEDMDFQEEILKNIYTENVSIIAVDLKDQAVEPILPHLYNLIFSNIKFVDMHKVYEDIFDRVPLSLLKYNWFLENISATRRGMYDTLKRLMDILISLPLAVASTVIYPIVWLAVKIDDGGDVFSKQVRVGHNNQSITLFKFRTMNIASDGGKWGDTENKVTKVGKFLRKSRVDELPQLWNVLSGDISLIGPRPEFPDAVKHYTREIPYYNVRHLIKPGLSGWAQIYHDKHPHHEVDTFETKRKLSYDLYYIKNRSFVLDVKIALKTLKILILTKGI